MPAAGSVRRACVFAHYDRDAVVDPYVRYYLSALLQEVDKLVFVSVSELSADACSSLEDMGCMVHLRPNVGYDFCSYQYGLQQLDWDDFDELLLCNDSVYGPVVPLAPVFQAMAARGIDGWGLTENFEIDRHLQSYFLVFTARVLRSQVFRAFWDGVEVLSDKREIIRRYEVGLSQTLREAGFELAALVDFDRVDGVQRLRQSWRQYLKTVKRRWREQAFWLDAAGVLSGRRQLGVNPAHQEWQSLLRNHGLPTLKIELLRDNPKGLDDFDQLEPVLARLGDYPPELISEHLSRMVLARGKA